ncbi:MAG: hypothetical protein AB9M53_01090 [Leptothrix sp. (in: b-proteobacteria)]
MSTRAWGNTTDRILATLREVGPLTTAELADRLGVPQSNIASAMVRLGRVAERGPGTGARRAHITTWRHGLGTARLYPRPVWKVGHGDDAPRPVADQNAVKRRYWARRRDRMEAQDLAA